MVWGVGSVGLVFWVKGLVFSHWGLGRFRVLDLALVSGDLRAVLLVAQVAEECALTQMNFEPHISPSHSILLVFI